MLIKTCIIFIYSEHCNDLLPYLLLQQPKMSISREDEYTPFSNKLFMEKDNPLSAISIKI